MVEVAQRAWRILRHIPRYSTGAAVADRAEADGIKLQPGEELLGVYDNPAGPALYVTNQAVRWGGGHVVEYRRITSNTVPGEKTAAVRLIVTLDDGATETLPINGGEGRLRDVWEFKRYMDRVLDDVRESA